MNFLSFYMTPLHFFCSIENTSFGVILLYSHFPHNREAEELAEVEKELVCVFTVL